MIETAFQNAEEFGFRSGDIVQEWLWDDDVDDSIREKIEQLTGEELVDEDYDSAVDGVIIWWRDGDDEDLERAAANLGINLSRNESASVEDLA